MSYTMELTKTTEGWLFPAQKKFKNWREEHYPDSNCKKQRATQGKSTEVRVFEWWGLYNAELGKYRDVLVEYYFNMNGEGSFEFYEGVLRTHLEKQLTEQ